MATVVFRDSGTFDDGSRYEMVATSVPESASYPEGVKYRFQYMAADGTTLLRYDNFPDHPNADRHHYHAADGVHDDVEFTGLREHARAFYDAMDDLRDG